MLRLCLTLNQPVRQQVVIQYFFQKFEENISEALSKMKKSQKQFIQSNVVAIISSQSEILERHGKLLDSICSKIDNVQKSSV